MRRDESTGPPPGPTTSRQTSLDGLRGLAAAVVVVSHLLLVSPAIDDALTAGDRDGRLAWLVYSPLHVLWDGPTAVWVFFVISGFVLAGAVGLDPRSWRGYYPRRLFRLYVPVWLTLALAVILMTLVPREGGPGFSTTMTRLAVDPDPGTVLRDALLLGGVSEINGVLWTLRWEVGFSLALPVYVWFATARRELWLVKLLGCCALVFAGAALQQVWLFIPPIFAIGVLLNLERERVAAALRRAPRGTTAAALVVSILALNAVYWPLPVPVANAVSVMGAALLVALFVHSPRVRRLGDARPAQWLGAVSFSLYLTHIPVILTVVALCGPGRSGLAIAVSSVVVLPVAAVVYVVLERPAHRVSRRLGGLGAGTARRRPAGPADRPDRPGRQGPTDSPVSERRPRVN